MTGREPARFSIHTALNVNWTANAAQGQADFLPPETVTITHLLHQAGYRVGHYGKWYVPLRLPVVLDKYFVLCISCGFCDVKIGTV